MADTYAFVPVDPVDAKRRASHHIVVASAELAAQLLGGTAADWVRTKSDANERYPSRGDEYDPTSREKFKPRTRAVEVKDEQVGR